MHGKVPIRCVEQIVPAPDFGLQQVEDEQMATWRGARAELRTLFESSVT
jgi:hypothetical protein